MESRSGLSERPGRTFRCTVPAGQVTCHSSKAVDVDWNNNSASRQPLKTLTMAAKIRVREGESIDSALERFRKVVSSAYRRQFYKKRIGCYDKPSDRRRRKNSTGQRREAIRQRSGWANPLDVFLNLRQLHSRGEDPFRS